jgi:hypothetical protein
MNKFRGRDGRTLAEHWGEAAATYLGTTVTGFPNLFIMTGPYTAVGHTSIIYMLESQFEYVLGALRVMRSENVGALDVRKEALSAFASEMDERLTGTVWNSGCKSWYLDARGKNTSIWPTFTFRFRARTSRFDARAYHQEPRRQSSQAHVN